MSYLLRLRLRLSLSAVLLLLPFSKASRCNARRRAAAQRSSRARGCASRLAGGSASVALSLHRLSLLRRLFFDCFWAASCSAMFDSAVMVTPFFCLHPEAVYPFSQCGGCTHDPQFFPSKQKMTKYYFFSFIHRIR